MFCPKCGGQNDDNVEYCRQCGNLLTAKAQNPSVPNNTEYRQTFQPQPPIEEAQIVRSPHPVLNAVKNLGASPLYLVAIIAFSVSILFSIIYSVSGSSTISTSMYQLIDQLNIPLPDLSWLFDVLDATQGTYIVTALIGMTPSILVAVGMWMIFASAVDRQNGGMKTAGLTIIKVILIIYLVFYCLIAFLFEIVMIAILGGVSSYSGSYGPYAYAASPVVIVVFIVSILLVGGAFALGIIYDVKIIKTVNTMKNTIMTGVPSDKVSSFAAVFCFIAGGFMAISAFGRGDVAAVIAGLASATATICFGIFIFSYRNKMRTLITPNVFQQQYPYSQPAVQYGYTQNAYQQQPQNAYQPQTNQQYYPQNNTPVSNDNNAQNNNQQNNNQQ